MIKTSDQHANHLFAGPNTQQPSKLDQALLLYHIIPLHNCTLKNLGANRPSQMENLFEKLSLASL